MFQLKLKNDVGEAECPINVLVVGELLVYLPCYCSLTDAMCSIQLIQVLVLYLSLENPTLQSYWCNSTVQLFMFQLFFFSGSFSFIPTSSPSNLLLSWLLNCSLSQNSYMIFLVSFVVILVTILPMQSFFLTVTCSNHSSLPSLSWSQVISSHIRSYQVVSGRIRLYQVISSHIKQTVVLMFLT